MTSTQQASSVSDVTLRWERTEGGGRRLGGARLTHQERKTTTYTLKNNASAPAGPEGGDKVPVPLYIDHSADPRHDGYAIQTTERAIKQTTAFSRYRVELAPQEELTFLVEGHAVLKAPARAALAAFVKRDERAALLTKVEREL